MENKKLKKCKSCGAEIAKSAKSCPHCGAKNRGAGRIIIICLVVFFLIGAIASGDETDDGTTQQTPNTEQTPTEPAPAITYTAYDVSDMVDDLDANALKAEEKYNGQCVEVTGCLSVIDSDGKYIHLVPIGDPYAIFGVQCYIKNDEQRAQVMEMEIDDTVTVQGKITEVGEIMSFALNIDNIVS